MKGTDKYFCFFQKHFEKCNRRGLAREPDQASPFLSKPLLKKTAAADMKIVLCVYVGMSDACSLMQAPGIRAQNYSRLPRSQSTVCYLI